jgi:hypothetical protein
MITKKKKKKKKMETWKDGKMERWALQNPQMM